MGTLVVVELEIAGEALPGLAGAAIGVQIDLLVFDGAPEALGEDIVQGAALAIHADLNAALLQAPQVLRAGEVGALIAVPDGRTAYGQGGIDGGEHKADLQALVQLPGHHIARVPVEHGDQIEPARLQAHVGDIDPPDMVRVGRFQVPQQVRIDGVRRMPTARVWPGRDSGEAHLLHVALYRFAVDDLTLLAQHRGDPPRPIIGMRRIDLVDAMLEPDLL